MWGQESARALQFLHSWFGVGLTVAPLLAAPFLSPTHCEYLNNTINNASYRNHSNVTLQTHIHIPYAMCGGVGVVGGIILIIFYILKLRITIGTSSVANRKWTELFSPASCAGGKLCFGTAFMMLLFFIYLLMVGKDNSLSAFMEPLVVDHANFTKTEGALLLTTFSASFTLARFVATALGILIPLNVLLFMEIIGNLGAAIAIYVIPLQQEWHLWAFVSLFGFFAGPMYASGMAWADQYIEITALAVGVIDFGIGIGGAAGPYLIGYLLTYMGPMYVLLFCVVCAASLLVFLTIAQIIGSCNGLRERDY